MGQEQMPVVRSPLPVDNGGRRSMPRRAAPEVFKVEVSSGNTPGRNERAQKTRKWRQIGGQSVAFCREMSPSVAFCRLVKKEVFEGETGLAGEKWIGCEKAQKNAKNRISGMGKRTGSVLSGFARFFLHASVISQGDAAPKAFGGASTPAPQRGRPTGYIRLFSLIPACWRIFFTEMNWNRTNRTDGTHGLPTLANSNPLTHNYAYLRLMEEKF